MVWLIGNINSVHRSGRYLTDNVYKSIQIIEGCTNLLQQQALSFAYKAIIHTLEPRAQLIADTFMYSFMPTT